MDPLTQGALGAAAAQALVGHRLPRAWLVGAFAGILPDADVFIRSATDPLLAVEHHRGFTHALAFIPFGGTLAALPFLASRRYRAQPRALIAGSLIGYATHGLLDAFTTYGTQLLWPFTDLRLAWDWIAIVDPVFTLVLLAGVVAAARLGRRTPAALALALCTLYLAWGGIQRTRALDALERVADARGHAVERMEVFPFFASNRVWRGLYRTGGTLYTDRIFVPWAGEPLLSDGTHVPALDALPDSLARIPRIADDFERFRWFTDRWTAHAPGPPEPGASPVIGDARYSLQTDRFAPIWGIRFRPGDAVPTAWIDRTNARELTLGALWRETIGIAPGYRPLPRRR